jgi:hypothetical protein
MMIGFCFFLTLLLILIKLTLMVSTRRKKAVVSTEFIEDSDESDGNDTYQEDACVSLHFFHL